MIAVAGAGVLMAVAGPAFAVDAPGIDKLSKQALEAFDGLNFDQAKTLLEKAISDGDDSGLDHDPAVARAHLDLGMVLIAGFHQRDEALSHFKAALSIKPGIAPPAGLFNPEVQEVFDEAKKSTASENDARVAALAPKRTARASRPVAVKSQKEPAEKEATTEDEKEEEEEEAGGGAATGFYLGFGLGSGGGIARGPFDANKGLMPDNTWSGGLATSRLGHLAVDVGYFASRDLLLAVEGRLQFISGTTDVVGTAECPGTCSPPSTGIAVLGKATYFLSSGIARPFLVGGIGGGAIRQVVKLNVTADSSGNTHCGSSQKDACVDTVTGGPLLLAAGGGFSYQVGTVSLVGSLVADVGLPNRMLNFDVTLGVGLRL